MRRDISGLPIIFCLFGGGALDGEEGSPQQAQERGPEEERTTAPLARTASD
jgi:hypothetical protein